MSVVVAPATAVSAPAPLKGEIGDTIQRAAKIGYDAIQPTINRPGEFDLVAARKALRETGLTVTSIATGSAYPIDGISLGHGDLDRRRAAVERMRQHIDLAYQLDGANVVIGLIRGRFSDSPSKQDYMGHYRESLNHVLDHAIRSGIVLVHEAIGRTDSDVLRTIDENIAFLEEFNSAHLRLHIDTHHIALEEVDWPGALRRAAPMIEQVDISDVERRTPDGSRFDFPSFLSALDDIGHDGYLIHEYQSVGEGMGEAEAGLAYIRSLSKK
ncbi:sugar phosphate isomerase/epimerase family protein [Novosphingobium terrae]|uniref:sugar phosphate isomerase/epimerase family protein n=1 Tax=Novosphingobium terrae TaxID=2726189 RepID=UPI00197D705E|nr:sugar phosphate isomerase/epimerase family protein [Novosphingobium terrae]